MTISAKVICASYSTPDTPALISMELRYPRFIHSEFMTHRVFSRNASSSRAVPVKKMIQDVLDDPAMPVAWGSNQPGMQAGAEIDTPVRIKMLGSYKDWPYAPDKAWLEARDRAVAVAQAFMEAGYHKQIVNRLLEPFAHITVIVTATEWKNFFELRCHPDADPTMRELAEAILLAQGGMEPQYLRKGQWHLPYVSRHDEVEAIERGYRDADAQKRALRLISAARCARVSYLNHDGTAPDWEKDMELANRLLSSRHMSPFEHQGSPDPDGTMKPWWGNLSKWVQSRKLFEAHL